MWDWWKRKPEEKPVEAKREYVAFPSLTPDGEKRFAELSASMDVAGRCGPKYACRLLLRHILNLEGRINELERKPVPINQEIKDALDAGKDSTGLCTVRDAVAFMSDPLRYFERNRSD